MKYIILILNLFLLSNCQSQTVRSMLAEKGMLDLTKVDFKHSEIATLNGQWEFYWKKLYSPADFKNRKIKPDTFVFCPSIWNNYVINDTTLTGKGFATYRLTVKTKAEHTKFAIRTKYQLTAFKIFVDGELLIENGKVSDKYNQMEAWYLPAIAFFETNKTEHEIVMQISNNHHKNGGFTSSVLIGLQKDILKYRDNAFARDAFILGLIFLMSLYSFGLYLFRHKDKTSLLFSLMMLLLSVRTAITEEYLFVYFFQDIPWRTLHLIEYISFFLLPASALLYFNNLFSKYTNKVLVYSLSILGLLYSLVTLFSNSIFNSKLITSYNFIIIIIISYTIYILIKAGIKKEISAYLMIFGVLIFLSATVHDVVIYQAGITANRMIHIGSVVFIITQALAFSFHVFNTESEKNKIEQQSKIIDLKNTQLHNLNNEIQTQTETLQLANEKLEELDELKQGMTSMLVHDLKNPISTILSLAQNNEILLASRQMLNMVSNILDVQKYEDTKMVLDTKPHSLYTLSTQAVAEVRLLAENRNIKIQNNFKTNTFINTDDEITNRIFVNLLTNAIKHSRENGNVTINCKKDTENPDFVKISITDNGSGIPNNKLNTIFNKFTQVMAKNSGQARSTGLGLTFCKMAVEAHGGNIGVTSIPNKETTFSFTLPLAKDISILEDVIVVDEKIEKLQLNKEEEKYLQAFIKEYQKYKIYDILPIRKITESIDENFSDSIKLWKNKMQKIVYNSNEVEYNNLILGSVTNW